jgi:hypothetical protein
VNLVDSCGWLEYFAAGPNADFFAPACAFLKFSSASCSNAAKAMHYALLP